MTTEATTKIESIPHDLQSYIERKQNARVEGDSCDNRATPLTVLDQIRDDCIRWHNVGKEFIASLESAEVNRCFRFYRDSGLYEGSQYHASDLVESRVTGFWMIVPKYITIVREVRKYKELLAP